jgi:hypothetical protein
VEQKTDVRGKRIYLLSSKMTELDYLTEVPSFCGPKDTNAAAFIEATSIIRGRDVVEEFLACDLWSLSEKFGFNVESTKSPLSKVVVLMPQVTATIDKQEPVAKFEARIESVVNLLVGNYNVVEHKAYQGLQHGRLIVFSNGPGFSAGLDPSLSC